MPVNQWSFLCQYGSERSDSEKTKETVPLLIRFLSDFGESEYHYKVVWLMKTTWYPTRQISLRSLIFSVSFMNYFTWKK